MLDRPESAVVVDERLPGLGELVAVEVRRDALDEVPVALHPRAVAPLAGAARTVIAWVAWPVLPLLSVTVKRTVLAPGVL